MPVEGGATYVGSAGGLYAYEYGSNWGELEGTTVFEEYEGIITLRADFSQETIQGCIGCEGDITIRRSHLRSALGWRPQASGKALEAGRAEGPVQTAETKETVAP